MSQITIQELERNMERVREAMGVPVSLLRQPMFSAIAISERSAHAMAKVIDSQAQMAKSLFGMAVRTLPEQFARIPKMQLSREFAEQMPAEFIAETNAWMADFFGYHEVAYLIDESAALNPLARFTL